MKARLGAAAGLAGVVGLAGVAGYDILQRRHSILRNFPVVGHLRFMLESIGPELRQYIVTDNDEERPFSRDQRRWVYAAAHAADTSLGYGTDNELDHSSGYVVVKPDAFPAPPPTLHEGRTDYPLPVGKVVGAGHRRQGAFRPDSVVNISGMSFGALSAPAVTALNRGAEMAGCLQNTGEGGISPYHRRGGALIWQIGTGYFGCRDAQGRFDLARLVAQTESAPVRALEVKLSQGAKPGLGGMLPGVKVTPEIAAIRGVPVGVDCVSPASHTAFSGIDGLIEFVERLAAATGLPVGIKSAVGEEDFWLRLTARMATTGGGPDFVTVDGGEGGTGAAPPVFADHVSLPFLVGFPRVYRAFAEHGLHEKVAFAGSGRLGLPDRALLALGLGCDWLNVGREAMLSVGCVQSQRCHTGRCPTGVATQNRWLTRGLDAESKSQRCAAYVTTLRRDLTRVAVASGYAHPALVPLERFELLSDPYGAIPAPTAFGYRVEWGLPSWEDRSLLGAIMDASAPQSGASESAGNPR